MISAHKKYLKNIFDMKNKMKTVEINPLKNEGGLRFLLYDTQFL